ncbi:PHP domain-containing protein [Candidatus Saganbacteria bacterium]|nr:PHP domain-containing protein [Candidatus Saganbacteria bacterium]
MKKLPIIADFHVHTISSGHAYSTLQEYVDQAKKIGLRYIAITDHGPAMPGGPHIYHFNNMKMIPKEIDGIKVLRGVEANIVNDNGDIDLTEADIDYGGLQIVMVALHPYLGYEHQGEEKNTKVLIKALKTKRINIIAHPGNPKYPIKVKEMVAAAKEHGVLIEINNSSDHSRPGSSDKCLEFAKEVKRAGWKVILGSDSHIASMVGKFDLALKLCKEAGLGPDDIINTSEYLIKKYVLERK